jgi:catechol 2,3-dioxygenase-like lactoylglutathione lyase family enzyme
VGFWSERADLFLLFFPCQPFQSQDGTLYSLCLLPIPTVADRDGPPVFPTSQDLARPRALPMYADFPPFLSFLRTLYCSLRPPSSPRRDLDPLTTSLSPTSKQSARTDASPLFSTLADSKNLPRSVSFYRDTLRLGSPVLDTDRMAVFPLGQTTLLLFARGLTQEDQPAPPPSSAVAGAGETNGPIPGHGLPGDDTTTKLKTHFALAVEKKDDVLEWEKELKAKDVKVLSTVDWPKGGRSV